MLKALQEWSGVIALFTAIFAAGVSWATLNAKVEGLEAELRELEKRTGRSSEMLARQCIALSEVVAKRDDVWGSANLAMTRLGCERR